MSAVEKRGSPELWNSRFGTFWDGTEDLDR